MLSVGDFIRQSLEIHLFFVRIMKEHSFFLQTSFTPKNANFIQRADYFRKEFDNLLRDTILLSNGVVSPAVLHSGEVITRYTLKAELATAYFTGVELQTQLTQAEANLMAGGAMTANSMLERNVSILNEKAIKLVEALIQFKSLVLENVQSCKMFTTNYPHMIDHIIREGKIYLELVKMLQNKQEIDEKLEKYAQEYVWNHIMGDHAKFIRGMLDPTEENLIMTANSFAKEFEQLADEAKQAMDKLLTDNNVTQQSLDATTRLRDFKAAGTEGILECKIKSIIVPLLADHVLREANHYLRILKML